MPSGGPRKNSGRKLKWGEKSVKIGVPSSIGNDLVAMLEYLWEKEGIRDQDLIDTLRSAKFRKIRKYAYPVSAGANSTSISGELIDADYEEIDLLDVLIPEPSKTIIIPVTGDSMIDIGIFPGDWLIVEKIDSLYQRPKEEDVVIATVNDETLVKRYRTENGQVVLVSENKDHPPIHPSEGSIHISGIVRNAIRRNLSKL